MLQTAAGEYLIVFCAVIGMFLAAPRRLARRHDGVRRDGRHRLRSRRHDELPDRTADRCPHDAHPGLLAAARAVAARGAAVRRCSAALA
ncbi:hypothetical protein [Thauera humireducens]|uniref:hypothetical protein n=1 Tax=Thauera humireducens TaxID=1134435 RepID=UPI00311D673C